MRLQKIMGLGLLNGRLILVKADYYDTQLRVIDMVIQNPKVLAFDNDNLESVAANGTSLLKQYQQKTTNGVYVGLYSH